jgi:hypothetical protein
MDATSRSSPTIAKSAAARIRHVDYADDETLLRARARYFAANGFAADGGYDEPWVDFSLGPLAMPFPNTAARKHAVRYHDLHHVLTGYQTDIYGEAEISAWELAAGCRRAPAAWVLNLAGMALGVLIAPRRTWRAWLRGRHSQTLYQHAFGDALLSRSVGDLRRELGIDRQPTDARAADVLLFVAHWQLGAWGTLATTPLAVLSIVAAAIAGLWRKRATSSAA